MSDDSLPSVINRKRDTSSPLQDPSDSYKRTKQAKQESEKSLSDINDSYIAIDSTLNSLDTSSFPDLPEADASETSDYSIESPADRKENMTSLISNEDISRIAQAVRSIMVPDMQAIIDKHVDALKTEYDGKISVTER